MGKCRFSRYAQPLLSLAVFCCLSAQAQTPASPVAKLQSLAELKAPSSAPRALKIQAWKTLAGTKVLFIQTSELPMFDVLVSFAAGSARDPQHPALAATTFSLLNEGIQGMGLAQINETFDSLGARLDMGISQDRTSFSMRSLSAPQKREPALQLFAQILGQPLLADDALVTGQERAKGTPCVPAARPRDPSFPGHEGITLQRAPLCPGDLRNDTGPGNPDARTGPGLS